MSKYSTEDRFRSSSPPFSSQSANPSRNYEKHRELLYQQLAELPNSPKSKQKFEQTFDDMLKSVHFFKKPDIIPFPYMNFDHSEVTSVDFKQKDLLEELEKERALRKAAESENEYLKGKLSYLVDLELQFEEFKVKSQRTSELESEIDRLNHRIRLLTQEIDELRRKLERTNDSNTASRRLQQDLENQVNKNNELLRQLAEFKDAYEELRRAYAKDINVQKDRFDKLYEEKAQLELKLRSVRFERPEREDFSIASPGEDEMQGRLRNIRQEYRDKLRTLEDKLNPERPDDNFDVKIKDIEDRLASLQGKIIDQSEANSNWLNQNTPQNPAVISRRSRGSSPAKDRYSPLSTWKSDADSRPKTSQSKANPLQMTSPRNDGRRGSGLAQSPSRVSPKRGHAAASGSPSGLRIQVSPDSRSASRHRLFDQHAECERCVKRHGHEWAKSPKH